MPALPMCRHPCLRQPIFSPCELGRRGGIAQLPPPVAGSAGFGARGVRGVLLRHARLPGHLHGHHNQAGEAAGGAGEWEGSCVLMCCFLGLSSPPLLPRLWCCCAGTWPGACRMPGSGKTAALLDRNGAKRHSSPPLLCFANHSAFPLQGGIYHMGLHVGGPLSQAHVSMPLGLVQL